MLASDFNPWSYAKLGKELAMSPSHVFESVARAEAAHLIPFFPSSPMRRSSVPQPNRSNLKEFLIHGVKYAFPVERGGPTRGIPTAEAAPPSINISPKASHSRRSGRAPITMSGQREGLNFLRCTRT